jgi:hypothetical protein
LFLFPAGLRSVRQREDPAPDVRVDLSGQGIHRSLRPGACREGWGGLGFEVALKKDSGVFTQSDILARCHMAQHTKIGSILFLSYDKFMYAIWHKFTSTCRTV